MHRKPMCTLKKVKSKGLSRQSTLKETKKPCVKSICRKFFCAETERHSIRGASASGAVKL